MDNIDKAKELVDEMELSNGEKVRLKRAIGNASDPFERGYIDRFYYDGKHNRELTIKIQELIRS